LLQTDHTSYSRGVELSCLRSSDLAAIFEKRRISAYVENPELLLTQSLFRRASKGDVQHLNHVVEESRFPVVVGQVKISVGAIKELHMDMAVFNFHFEIERKPSIGIGVRAIFQSYT